MPGSSARFRKSAVWPRAPLDSIARRNCSAVSCDTPMPTKTIANSSRAVAAQPRALRDLGGEAIVRQAAGREERQLLPAHQAVHQVDGRDAGLDEVPRQRAPGRVDRQAFDAHPRARRDRRAAVDGTAQAVEHAAQHVRAHSEQQRLRAQPDAACRRAPSPAVDCSTSMTIEVRRVRRHDRGARRRRRPGPRPPRSVPRVPRAGRTAAGPRSG